MTLYYYFTTSTCNFNYGHGAKISLENSVSARSTNYNVIKAMESKEFREIKGNAMCHYPVTTHPVTTESTVQQKLHSLALKPSNDYSQSLSEVSYVNEL